MECFLCCECFINIDKYLNHLTVTHVYKNNDVLRCNVCESAFTCKNSFKRHLRYVHKEIFGKATNENTNQKSSRGRMCVVGVNDNNNNDEQYGMFNNGATNIYDTDEIDDKIQHLNKNNLQFHTNLYSINNMSRKNAENIQTSLSTLLITPLLEIFQSFANKLDGNLKHELSETIDKCDNILRSLKNEYLLVKELKKRDLYYDLNVDIIDNSEGLFNEAGSLTFKNKETSIATISLAHSFRKIFTKNDLLLDVLKNMDDINKNGTFTNIIQGEIWENKKAKYPGKLLIPYFLYSDDIEVNNPLGSHSSTHSVTNFYYSFPTLPQDDTKLENIFLAASIKSSYLKKFGVEKCLQSLVDQLILLEVTGINITLNGETYNPHFILVLILGDNLGLNTVLGYSKSFSGVFCRFCKTDKKLSEKTACAIPELRRNYDNYHTDLAHNNPSATGIVSDCVFNNIPSFHVLENLTVDAMHDILEGICHYDLSLSIIYFIDTKKYFSLETLNNRKKNFEYGELEIGNISPDIARGHLKHRHLKMSASEMKTFVMYFPLMVGDMIPPDDEVWLFILSLVQILDKILAYKVTDFSISSLEALIKKHNTQFMNIFKVTLKPKHHILTHYPEVMRKCGPVRKFWSFQFESKHRSFKVYTHAITSRKNICLSMEKKYQFVFADLLLKNCKNNDLIALEKHRVECGFVDLISSKLNMPTNELKFYNKVVFKHILYKKHFFVAECDIDYYIHRIVNVVVVGKTVYIFAEKLKDIKYHNHFKAFEVDVNNVEEHVILHLNNIVGPPTTVIKTHAGKNMIRIKELL